MDKKTSLVKRRQMFRGRRWKELSNGYYGDGIVPVKILWFWMRIMDRASKSRRETTQNSTSN